MKNQIFVYFLFFKILKLCYTIMSHYILASQNTDCHSKGIVLNYKFSASLFCCGLAGTLGYAYFYYFVSPLWNFEICI